MARTKTNLATSTEKNTKVEAAETTETKEEVIVETPIETEESTETKEEVVETTETKAKKYKDDAKVKIKALHRAGKSVIGLDINNPIFFDVNGIAETTGKEANRLLTIPGFELA